MNGTFKPWLIFLLLISLPIVSAAPTVDCPDFSGDETINLFDLVLVALKFGTTDVTADLDQQGTVDIPDLLLVIQKFGVNCFAGEIIIPFTLELKPGVLPIYDGEPGSFETQKATHIETLPGEGLEGSNGLRIQAPNGDNVPSFIPNEPSYRANFGLFDVLEFYFRTTATDPGNPTIRLIECCKYASNTLSINNYIVDSGPLDNTFKKISIPVSDFATADWSLAGVDRIHFNPDNETRVYFLDNMQLLDATSPMLENVKPETNKILKVNFSESFDFQTAYNLKNFELTSPTDPNYSSPQNPIDTGIHIRYQFHEDGAHLTDPTNAYEVFLEFGAPLTEGSEYNLSVQGIKDPIGNALVPTITGFTYTEDRIVPHIKINQEGYLPQRTNKIGYVGGYFGTLGGGSWAVGESGAIFSFDKQNGWQQVNSPTTNTLRGVAATRNDDVWVVGDGGIIVHFDGTNWSTVPSNTTNNLNAVYFDSKNVGWAVGDNGTLLRYAGSWQNVSGVPTSKNLNDVWAKNIEKQEVLVVGDTGTILTFDGTTWNDLSGVTSSNLYAIGGRVDTTADYIVGENGVVLLFVYKWEIAPISGTSGVTWRGIDVNPNKTNSYGYIAGDNGTIWQINKTGDSLATVDSGTTEAINAIEYIENREWIGAGANNSLVDITTNFLGEHDSATLTSFPVSTTIYAMDHVIQGPLRLPKTLSQVEIRKVGDNSTVFSAPLNMRMANYFLSGEDVYTFDFSDLQTTGDYRVYLQGVGYSQPFRIGSDALDKVALLTSKYLYHVRSGSAIEAQYSDPIFARPAGHDVTIDAAFHESLLDSPLYNGETVCPLGSSSCPPESMKDVTGGWYDAGDYGKYLTPAAPGTWIMLASFDVGGPAIFGDDWNLPESGNGVPDILDEARWEIDWIAKMQDPSDGGFYNKVVAQTWEGGTPDNSDLGGQVVRFIMEKTTVDTGSGTAILANASRIWQDYDSDLSASYLQQAELGWQFLQLHPDILPVGGFVNPPGHNSGPYPDPDDLDNRCWAATELYRTTGETEYDDFVNQECSKLTRGSNPWQEVGRQGQWAYIQSDWPGVNTTLQQTYRTNFNAGLGEFLYNKTQNQVYMDGSRLDVPVWINWGVMGVNTEEAFYLILNYHLFGDQKYLDAANLNADVTLGANPLSVSFVTGVGDVYPRDPLLGQSIYDPTDEPIPGYNVFGVAAHMPAGNPWNAEAQADRNNYPYLQYTHDSYPVLRRWADEHKLVRYNEGDLRSNYAPVYHLLKNLT